MAEKAAASGYPNALYDLAFLLAPREGETHLHDDTSIGMLTCAADKGHRGARLSLARLYSEGNGVARDHAKALKLYNACMEQGPTSYICRKIGMILLSGGQGVEQNKEQGIRMLELAAQDDDGKARYHLAVALRDGEASNGGGAEDRPNSRKALELFEEAGRNLLHYKSAWEAARMYERGEGVDRPDLERARELYTLAAKSGEHPESMRRLAELSGEPEEALGWYKEAARCGDARAMVDVGDMARRGLGGTPKDFASAIDHYTAAVAVSDAAVATTKGNAKSAAADAIARLGRMHEKGQGFRRPNRIKAARFYQRAVDRGSALGCILSARMLLAGNHPETAASVLLPAAGCGHPVAQCELAGILEREPDLAARVSEDGSYIVGRDCWGDSNRSERIVALYEASAAKSHRRAMYFLAMIYRRGRHGVIEDPRKAFKLLEEAARFGTVAEASFFMAEMLERGEGTDVDLRRARDCYRDAAKAGHLGALQGFERLQLALSGPPSHQCF